MEEERSIPGTGFYKLIYAKYEHEAAQRCYYVPVTPGHRHVCIDEGAASAHVAGVVHHVHLCG